MEPKYYVVSVKTGEIKESHLGEIYIDGFVLQGEYVCQVAGNKDYCRTYIRTDVEMNKIINNAGQIIYPYEEEHPAQIPDKLKTLLLLIG